MVMICCPFSGLENQPEIIWKNTRWWSNICRSQHIHAYPRSVSPFSSHRGERYALMSRVAPRNTHMFYATFPSSGASAYHCICVRLDVLVRLHATACVRIYIYIYVCVYVSLIAIIRRRARVFCCSTAPNHSALFALRPHAMDGSASAALMKRKAQLGAELADVCDVKSELSVGLKVASHGCYCSPPIMC